MGYDEHRLSEAGFVEGLHYRAIVDRRQGSVWDRIEVLDQNIRLAWIEEIACEYGKWMVMYSPEIVSSKIEEYKANISAAIKLAKEDPTSLVVVEDLPWCSLEHHKRGISKISPLGKKVLKDPFAYGVKTSDKSLEEIVAQSIAEESLKHYCPVCRKPWDSMDTYHVCSDNQSVFLQKLQDFQSQLTDE